MILGFKNQFVPAVQAGTKPHTLRTGTRWRVGMTIQFYQHVRQRNMAKFRPDAVVQVVQHVTIQPSTVRLGPAGQPCLIVDGRCLTPLECQELSRRDGFQDFAELLQFFKDTHGLPWEGQLVGWTNTHY